MLVSIETAAALLDLSPETLRKYLHRPGMRLSAFVRLDGDANAVAQHLSKATVRLDLWTLSEWLLLRSRQSTWDLKDAELPARREVWPFYVRLAFTAVLYRAINAVVKRAVKPGRLTAEERNAMTREVVDLVQRFGAKAETPKDRRLAAREDR